MLKVLWDEEFRHEIIRAVRGATKSIKIMTFKFDTPGHLSKRHMNALLTEISQATGRGVNVRCLFGRERAMSPVGKINRETGAMISRKGVKVRYGKEGRTHHAKLLIIDGAIAIVGSHNLTESSLCRNMEISLRTTNPFIVAELENLFMKEWLKSS